MIDQALLLALALFGQIAPATDAGPSGPANILTKRGAIIAKNDIRMAAEVEGLITSLPIRQGMLVAKGNVLATIDDRKVLAAVEVHEKNYLAAEERAKDDIEEQYAMAAAGVARMDFEMGMDANRRNPGVFSPIDIEKKRLDWKRASLQIEKARHDQLLAGLEADAKRAELAAARVELTYRQIVAPFDGQIEEVGFHESEWVKAGDPILRLVQFDVMYVDLPINVADYDPSELQGRPVTVVVSLARGRTATVKGHVIHASQTSIESSTSGGGLYMVRCEIENQRVGNFWLVRPGLNAEVTIHVDQPAIQLSDPVEQSAGVE